MHSIPSSRITSSNAGQPQNARSQLGKTLLFLILPGIKTFLRCDNLINLKKYPNLINKDYKLIDLNNELKNKLVSVNDFVKYINDDENFYVVLCNIKFDKEILNSVNFNKLINLNVNEIESKFVNKYSKIYNLKESYD